MEESVVGDPMSAFKNKSMSSGMNKGSMDLGSSRTVQKMLGLSKENSHRIVEEKVIEEKKEVKDNLKKK